VNIFYLSDDPVEAAKWMVDRHVVKMILESAQLLSTAHRYLDGKMLVAQNDNGRKMKRWVLDDARELALYKATHINHPSAVWCRTSVENYLWLVEHFAALLDEYTHRYGKRHKCSDLLYPLQSPPFNLKEYDRTKMLCAMPDEYKISADPVENYRQYYRVGKSRMHKWTNREAPEWIHG
jgi:hypothetical protein